jgi:hypothetical protein
MQHLLRALLEIRKERELTGEALPDVLKMVQMEYLYHSAPLSVRALAAGLHQRAQNSGEATSVADFYSVLVGMSRDKANTSTSGSGILSESELWHAIQRAGVLSDEPKGKLENKTPEEIYQLKVSLNLTRGPSLIFLYFPTETAGHLQVEDVCQLRLCNINDAGGGGQDPGGESRGRYHQARALQRAGCGAG